MIEFIFTYLGMVLVAMLAGIGLLTLCYLLLEGIDSIKREIK
jgi:hypothetical protein